MAHKSLYTAKQFIDAIPGTGGIISAIAKRVGCTWRTARTYIDTRPSVAEAYQDECEAVLDLAEAKTIEAIKAGDTGMIRYYLSTKGKKRGYVERVEQENSGALQIQVVYENPPEPPDATPDASAGNP